MNFNSIFCIPVVLLFLFATTVFAHTTLFYAGANGKLNAQGDYIVPSPGYGNAPVKNLNITDMRCRSKVPIESTNPQKLSVAAGETLSIQWHHIQNSVTVSVMSRSHIGPCMIYMAPLESNGDGNAWFKIYESGWDTTNKKWCTTKVIDNNGLFNATIPTNIPSGDYIVRTELLALHQAKQIGGAQFYPNCVIVTVTNGQGSSQPKGYAIPGIYAPTDPGILYDRASDPTKYIIPGPVVFADGSISDGTVANDTRTSSSIISNTALAIESAHSTAPTIVNVSTNISGNTSPANGKSTNGSSNGSSSSNGVKKCGYKKGKSKKCQANIQATKTLNANSYGHIEM
ncbi:glycosyl hydrolase family 61-domain-containing protein [Coemansia spiralis]|nr:glycosyl hydrolase family 61-domain-containing protein [Coemansia spiralis]